MCCSPEGHKESDTTKQLNKSNRTSKGALRSSVLFIERKPRLREVVCTVQQVNWDENAAPEVPVWGL